MNPKVPMPAAIRQLAADIAVPRERIETAFVAVGARLMEGAGMLNALTRQFEALPAALQGEDVREASHQLAGVAAKAAELSETLAQEKADLARLVEVVGAANGPIEVLRRTIKMMGIVSVNARVTAAGIVGDGEDFDVFTTDIATLSDSASRTIQEFALGYRQLAAEVDRAAAQRARFESAHAGTAAELARSLSHTLEILEAQRQAAVEGSAETGRLSRQIVGQIASAVSALQVGDSTRQRLEHIELGLDTMARLLDGQPAFSTELADEERAAMVATLAALEQAQMVETARSYAAEVGGAEAAIVSLSQDASVIMSRSRELVRTGEGGEGSELSLGQQLRVAVTVLRDFEGERAKLEAVANAVQRQVARLLEHVGAVQEIEANMRLVSLNAAVRCAQLGPRGASLTVIASQLRELTSETVIAAQAAMERFDESSQLAAAFGTGAGGDGSAHVGDLEQSTNRALDLLSRLDDRVAAATQALKSDGPKVIDRLRSAAAEMDGQSALAENMEDAALAIAGLSADALPGEASSALAAILAGLRKSYTMEAERSIHTRLVGHLEAVATPEAAPAQSGGDEEDLAAFMF